MKIRINNLLPLLIACMLAALTLWLRQAAEQPSDAERKANDSEPDAVVQNLSIAKLGEDGSSHYSMSAKRMLHFSSDDSTVLESPRFERRDPDGTRTTIAAARGKLTHDGNEAFFSGNVQMDRSARGGQLQARTESLHIIPDKELVETDRHVTITNGASTLSGTGMQIDKSRGQITLQSQVQGSYHAARR